jgi:hypothetical protein
MNVLGDVQAVKALDTLESRLHWNDPPLGVEWKLNVAVVWFVAAGGPASNTTAAAATPGQLAPTTKVSIASLTAPIVPALKPT